MASPLVEHLRAEVERASERTAAHTWSTVSSGIAPLDALLPAGGLRCGTLVEWLAAEQGCGATTLALAAAHSLLAAGRPLVIVDTPERRGGRFHPPGVRVADLGLAAPAGAWNWRQVLLVRAERIAADWAVDQALATSGVGAVLFRMDQDDERRLRRRQLAVERSGALGLVVRRMAKQPEACFADLRFQVTPLVAASSSNADPQERRVSLRLLRSRQGSPTAELEVSLSESSLREVPSERVAHPLPSVSASSGRRRTGT